MVLNKPFEDEVDEEYYDEEDEGSIGEGNGQTELKYINDEEESKKAQNLQY